MGHFQVAPKPRLQIEAMCKAIVVKIIISIKILRECEAEVDLALIQTSFLFLRKLCLKNNSLQKNNMIYIAKLEGLYQNKVNSSLVSTCNSVKWAI